MESKEDNDGVNPGFRWILITSILAALLSGWAAYYVTISSKSHKRIHNEAFNNVEQLHVLRPVLSENEMILINERVTYSETQIWTPNDQGIKFRHFMQVSDDGNFNLPDFFYEGILIGIADGNHHNVEYTNKRELSFTDLRKDLETLSPEPTYVMPRSSQYNETKWIDYGFAVYFSYDSLKKQNMVSRSPGKPFQMAIDAMLTTARNYRQVYITIWYPNKFGVDSIGSDNKYLHTVIVQEIIPTRTGLNGLKSSVVVWLSAINSIEPTKPETVIRKSNDRLSDMMTDIINRQNETSTLPHN